ncbi:putative multi-domain containing protein [Aduncisulcus paluster]|uniref:Multi-domain containing protein n=1 Tax=Aduncisulcus paluster TaxID=2918883 RepID=A0ABQ5KKL4_9EUKA|nr:putative multi-domain containing protein [Aduncisulcus paluster]
MTFTVSIPDDKNLDIIRETIKSSSATIFDLDGTILFSMKIWNIINTRFLGLYGIELTDDYTRVVRSMSSCHESASYTQSRYSIPLTPEQIIDKWNEIARDLYLSESHTPIRPGFEKLIDYLEKSEKLVGLATNLTKELTKVVLDERGMRKYFKAAFSSFEVAHPKPHPDVYEACLSSLGIDGKDAVAIEDTVTGAKAAIACGMKVIGVYDEASHYLWAELEKLCIGMVYDLASIIAE